MTIYMYTNMFSCLKTSDQMNTSMNSFKLISFEPFNESTTIS